MSPRPPCLRGRSIQARWEKWESVEQATTSQPSFRNSAALQDISGQGSEPRRTKNYASDSSTVPGPWNRSSFGDTVEGRPSLLNYFSCQ